MNLIARQFGYNAVYQEEAKDGTEGAAAGDRGDDYAAPPEDKDTVVDPKVAEAKAAEDKAAADKVAKDAEDKKRADEKAARDAGVTIPKARFDEALGKERARATAAEKALADLRGAQQSATTAEALKTLEGEIEKLEDSLEAKMTEGTPEERKALRAQIRAKTAELTRAEVNSRALEASAVAIEQVNYNALVGSLEAEYSFLVPETDGFDEKAAVEVMELKFAYESAGLGSTDALKKAVATLKHKLDGVKAELDKPAAEAKAKAEADAKAKATAAETVKKAEDAAKVAEEARRAAAVEKGVDAKGKVPPSTTVAGTPDTKVVARDVSKMSDADFDKLNDDEKKKLRGD